MHTEDPGRDVAVRRRISVGDIVVSILLWCCMPALLLTAALLDLSFLMFIDVCPPETCSVNGAISAVVVSGTCAFLVMLASIVWGIVRLVRRRLAWPVALGGLLLVIAALMLGFVVGFAALGWEPPWAG